MALRSILSYSNLKVEIRFPNGEVEAKPFKEIREYFLSIKDLAACANLIKYGEVIIGSLRYTILDTN
jgi:hypothetical protein